ncbi:MAG: VTT domain-containing protein [Nitrospira sp.]|nr:VTT domain-containing protein [Nitrospira sp.]
MDANAWAIGTVTDDPPTGQSATTAGCHRPLDGPPRNSDGLPPPILRCGSTCWRIEPAERATFLVDGDAYFRTFRDVALQAQQSIYIAGWDLDTQVELIREGEERASLPSKLGEFLTALLRRRRRLNIHVLNWDFAMIYALEREWMPAAQAGWSGHRRLLYRMDGQHPLGASHHQKIVVIDDTVAFVGGLDLTKSRWDTPAHVVRDPRRLDADGLAYPPFHDVQMMVAGEAASALGDLFRARWRVASSRRLPAPTRRPVADLWPETLPPDVERCQVGLMRTQPAFAGQPEVREIEQAYVEAIKRAREAIYIESQYFTSHAVGRALAARLSEHEGPEVVLVLRHNCDGWLERQTMDSLRTKVLHDLELADHYGRLCVCAPTVSGGDGTEWVAIHSKLLIVDDEFLCLGSANCSNRSMGFDTECNLALESRGDPRLQAAIAGLRNRLIAEHLGVEPTRLAGDVRRCGSLIQAIHTLRGGLRSLENGCFIGGEPVTVIPEQRLIDPERPMGVQDVFDSIVPAPARQDLSRRLLAGYVLLAAIGLLALTWRWMPVDNWLQTSGAIAQLQAMRHSPLGLCALLAGYVLGGLVALPITLLIVLTLLACGPWMGMGSALAGSLLSAATLFWLGRTLGRYHVQRFAGRRVAYLSRRLAQGGVWTMFLLRMIPIAPFSIVNLVAGSTSISLREFLLGTALGMSPGILLFSAMLYGVGGTLDAPTPLSLVGWGLFVGLTWSLIRYLSRHLPPMRPKSEVGTAHITSPAP